MNNEIGKEELEPIVWMKPEQKPEQSNSEIGVVIEYWVAVKINDTGKVICFIAEVEDDIWFCLDPACERVDFVGELLAWAEYTPPTFTGDIKS